MFNLFTGGEESKVNERGDGNAGDSIPVEVFDELEGEEEQVDPDGMPYVHRVDAMWGNVSIGPKSISKRRTKVRAW